MAIRFREHWLHSPRLPAEPMPFSQTLVPTFQPPVQMQTELLHLLPSQLITLVGHTRSRRLSVAWQKLQVFTLQILELDWSGPILRTTRPTCQETYFAINPRQTVPTVSIRMLM